MDRPAEAGDVGGAEEGGGGMRWLTLPLLPVAILFLVAGFRLWAKLCEKYEQRWWGGVSAWLAVGFPVGFAAIIGLVVYGAWLADSLSR